MNQLILKDHLEKLYPFKVIADLGSLTAAATNLGVGQSNLSHTMKILEEFLGVQLLNRQARGVTLTPEGEKLYEFSKRIFHQSESLEIELRNMGKDFHGVLKVATHEALATHVWPAFLQKMSRKFPELKISLISGRIEAIAKDVLNGNVDLALTVEPLNNPRLVKIPVYSDRFGFYVAYNEANLENNPVLKKKTVKKIDLEGIPLLTDTHAHIRQNLPIPQYLSLLGLKLSTSFTLNSFEAAVGLCSVGLGVCFMPRKAAEKALKAKQIREIKVEGVEKILGEHTIHTFYHRESQNKMLAPIVEELTSFMNR